MSSIKTLNLLCLLGISNVMTAQRSVVRSLLYDLQCAAIGGGVLAATIGTQFLWIQSIDGKIPANKALAGTAGVFLCTLAAKWFAQRESKTKPGIEGCRIASGRAMNKLINPCLGWVATVGMVTAGSHYGIFPFPTVDIACKTAIGYWSSWLYWNSER